MPRRDDIRTILLIGSGPIVIGQACEFDYSGTQACRVLREEGYRVVLVNSNPATIMTDPEFADATYIEPLDVETLRRVIEIERPDALLPTLGGQTALNLARELADVGRLGAQLERAGLQAREVQQLRGEVAHALDLAADLLEELAPRLVVEVLVGEQLGAGVDPGVGLEQLALGPDREDRDDSEDRGEDDQDERQRAPALPCGFPRFAHLVRTLSD